MKTTRKDHSGAKKLPKKPDLEVVLYHWTPTTNRNRINRLGLVPGRLSLQGEWRPPHICFADDVHLAWHLSGRIHTDIPEWDLWQCYPENQTSFDHWEIITDTYPDTGRTFVKEYRIYTRIFKRDLIYVGSRSQEKHPVK